MTDLGHDVQTDLVQTFGEAFQRAVTSQARERVAETLFNWLSFTARKRADSQIDRRLEEMRKRFVALSENFHLRYVDFQLVVKVSGDAENTLRMLERGTDWFDPAEDATALIVGAVLE